MWKMYREWNEEGKDGVVKGGVKMQEEAKEEEERENGGMKVDKEGGCGGGGRCRTHSNNLRLSSAQVK